MDRSAQAGRPSTAVICIRAEGTLHSNPHLRRSPKMANTNPQTGYAPVNGLRMYYEVFGTGRPLVVLHGAYMTIETMGQIVPSLAESRQVIGIEQADVFGFSTGGGVALQLAIRHPEVVRKLVVASASYTSDGMHPELLEMTPTITPEAFAGSPIEEAYLRTAPNPDDFPNLVTKLKRLDMEPFAWPQEDIRGIN